MRRRIRTLWRNIPRDLKVKDYSVDETVASDLLMSEPLTSISIGDAPAQREANQVLMKAVHVNLEIVKPDTIDWVQVRVMLVRDKQQIGDSTPLITQVLDPALSPLTLAFMNQHNFGRFDVLRDKTYFINDLGNAGQVSRRVRWNFKMASRVRFNGSGAADIQKNGMYLMAVTDTASATATVSITGIVRTRWLG